MYKSASTAVALAAAALLGAGSAQAAPLAAGVNVGTPGVGLQVSGQVSSMLVVRGNVDGMSLSRDEEYSGVDYDGKLKTMTGGLFADVHPGGAPFFVSGGAYFGKRRIDLDAQPSGPVDIGGVTFTPAQVGRIAGKASLSDFQPFLGLGFDNTFSSDRTWGVRALAGVAFSKKPQVELSSSGGVLSQDPAFQARLAQEEADLREDAKNIRYFPVLQVGLTRRF